MSTFFPRQTIAWKLEEPPAFRKLSLSLVEMALITGIVLRLSRSLVLTHLDSGLAYVGVIALGALFLFGMVALHLGNYTLRQWVWRAPLFALVEVAGEMLTSLVLIAMHREPWGTERADFSHWMPMASDRLPERLLEITIFALLLAGVVQAVRYLLLRSERRSRPGTAATEPHDWDTSEHPPF